MKREIRYIQDVPLSYFEYCLKHTKSETEKGELKKIIRQFKGKK